MSSQLTVTSEQINSLPLLVGIIEEMGIREIIDAEIKAHGHWQGASVGTIVTIWLAHMLMERDHRLVMVRDWAAERAESINQLLGIQLRDVDCSDDRLANILSMLGSALVQARLDSACMQRWIRVYELPRQTMRLDSTSVSVYHNSTAPESLMQFGYSKDQRPDLKQFKVMMATLDPLGMPVMCQTVAGNEADETLYIPAYDAAVAALGTSALLIVGDSKMAALAVRGHFVASGSYYLSAYRPPSATKQITGWIDNALANAHKWQHIEEYNAKTGKPELKAAVMEWARQQQYLDAGSGETYSWSERVLMVLSTAYQQALRTKREETLRRLTEAIEKFRQQPKRGRKRYGSEEDLHRAVTKLIDEHRLTDIVHFSLTQTNAEHWIVESVWLDLAAWQQMVARLGWQVYVTNTTTEHYEALALVEAYNQQPIHERGFARLKTRNLQIRPVYLRDEERISGLLWLLCLALRVLTLTEYRVRQALAQHKEKLVGLNPASRTQATDKPTTERIFKLFSNITLTTIIDQFGHSQRHVTPLSPLQQQIILLLRLPPDLYLRLAASNLTTHLRE